MKKKVIISSESSNLHTTKRFIEEVNSLKMTPVIQNPYKFYFNFNEKIKNANHIKLFLHRTSGIRFDDFDLLVAIYFQQNGIKVINSPSDLTPFREKDSQIFFLNKHKLSPIPTFVFRGEPNNEIISTINKMSKSEEFILKMNRGNGGIGVQYIKSLKSLTSVLETFHAIKDQKMIIQPYLKHTKEFRLFVTNKLEMYLIEKEINSQDFRGNKNKSTAKLITSIPKEIKAMAEYIIEKTKLHYLGIDFFYYKNELQILEINTVPGFETIENLTNKNIAREILLLQ